MIPTPLYALTLAGLAALAAGARGEVRISEVMASNKLGITDEAGAHSDWIELHNTGAQAVNLQGWHLTDDAQRPRRWEFPQTVVPAGGFVIVFASGRDIGSAGSPLHTDFNLAAEGEYLALTDPEGEIVDDFAPGYPPQVADVSWGQVPGQPMGTRAYFYTPTPGAANALASRAADPPVIGSRGMTFFSGLSVNITATQPDAQIYYTLDGSQPVAGGNLYTGPLLLAATTRLCAVASVPGLLPSPVRGENFIQLAPGLNPSSNLPLVVIDNFAGGRPDSDTSAAWMIFEPSEETGMATLFSQPALTCSASIKVRGSSTAAAAKYSLAVESQNEAGGDRDLPVLGLPEDSDWVLQAPYEYDRALIRNSLMYALSNESGRYAPRTRQVEVYLNTDGGPLTAADYFGVYTLTEKIKAGSERVDITRINPLDNGGSSVTGGYLLKIDRPDPGETGFTAATQTLYFVDPDEPNVSLPQRTWLADYLNSWWSALNAPNFYDPINGYARWGDPASFIDHHIFNVAAKNVDAFRLSAYFSKDRLGRLTAGPLWDFDRSLESTDGRDNNYNTWRGETGDLGTDFFQYPWYNEMFRDQNFWQAWIDRYDQLRRSSLSDAHVSALIATQAAELTGAAARNFGRWPEMYPRFGGWAGEVQNMESFLLNRLNWMDAQFTRPPAANTAGGPVAAGFSLNLASPSLARPNAKIYYTTDGSDPRLFDTTNSQSIVTSTFLPLNAPVKVYLPLTNIGSSWRGTGYDDSSWWSGVQGVGYDDGADYSPYIGFNLEAPPAERQMKNVAQSCYLRYHFNAAPVQIAGLTFLKLRVRCDDGMAVWLNGTKLPVSIKEPTPLLWNSGATTNTPDSEAVLFKEFTLTNPQSLLVPGDNVLAVHGLNFGLTSTDFLIQLELTGGYVPVDGPEISPEAIEYTGPLTISGTTNIVARTFDPAGPFTPYPYTTASQTPVGSHWSAPLRLTMLVGTQPPVASSLRVAELMYHPAALTAAEIAAGIGDREDFEYIVLENTSAVPLNLTGLQFAGSISFTVPLGPNCVLAPGQRGVLVKNLTAFEFRYSTPFPILGEYSGNLSNAGEFLELRDPGGSTLLTAAWDDAPDWPAGADGGGYSLVHRGVGFGFGDAQSWRASLDPMGELNPSPGFGGWQSAWFPNGGADALPAADPDKDGANNAAEFAAATSPVKPDAGAQPVAEAPNQTCISIAVRRRPGVNAWILESSTDIAAWSPVSAVPVVSPNADGSETVTWCFVKAAGKTYYRARALVE